LGARLFFIHRPHRVRNPRAAPQGVCVRGRRWALSPAPRSTRRGSPPRGMAVCARIPPAPMCTCFRDHLVILADRSKAGPEMDLQRNLSKFVEANADGTMSEVASNLIELLEADAVEVIGAPGRPIASEEIAERLETRLERVRKRDSEPEGLDVIEDAVAHL